MNILERIIATKREEVAVMEQELAPAEVQQRPKLKERLLEADGVIAEIKRASPSKGNIRLDVDVAAQARIYEQAGAAAISVLTDETYFKGSIEDLKQAAAAVSIPVLCKDFMVDERQIDRARNAGASIILLIVAALDDAEFRRLHGYAVKLGLEVLVEVHTEEEFERALAVGAEIIGINNRDLKSFTVSLERTVEIAAKFPAGTGRVLISESGIKTEEDAAYVFGHGASGILVGESLMRASDPGQWIKQATGVSV